MNWQFYNSLGSSSAARGYGINEPILEQHAEIISFAEKLHLHLPFTNLFESKSEIRKPFGERSKGRFLLKELEAGNYGHLIVTHFELLGKRPLDVKDTIEKFTARGAVIHILDLAGVEFSTGSDVGKMVENLINWAADAEAEYVRKDLRHTESIQKALDEKRESGLLTGSEPYGWNAVETGKIRVNASGKPVKIRRLEPNAEEQKWILHMDQCKVAGMSYAAIAKDLNSRNVSTKRTGQILNLRHNDRGAVVKKTKGKWQGAQVAKILNSKTVQDFLAS